jgi:quinol-cytochrome oxidoreductase complex cytochrome b subunit
MLGSYTVGNATVLRFYVAHVLGLPLLAAVAMMVHFWRVRLDGFSGRL